MTGIILFLAAIGMMAGEVGYDITKLHTISDMGTTEFIGNTLIHFSSVVTAFIGGKLLPNDPMQGGNRKSDPK